MKLAAYQAPLQAVGSMAVLDLIREQIDWCEANDVEILCCPEAVLGGLADYAADPASIAISASSGQLQKALAPLASERVTTILGFTEAGQNKKIYNSAAVFHKGNVTGVYRKLRPAINRSVYRAGDKMPVFTTGKLTFGIVICYDSNFSAPVRIMAEKGAKALFIPTNNGLPPEKGGKELIDASRSADVARAVENGIFVIRADVAGHSENMVSYGSSGITAPDGALLKSARQLVPDLNVADIEIA